MVYFIVLAILIYCIYTYDYRKQKVGDMVFYIFICILLIFIAGLRYRIGGDSIGYENEYRNLPTLAHLGAFRFNSIRWEPGFTMLMIFSKTFSSDFTLFQFLHATIVNSIIFWFIFKNTENKFICAFLYCIGMYLNFNTEVLRESLAVCVFLLAWPFFRKGQWIFYYLLCSFACFFHTSAFFTLILPVFAIPGIRGGFRLGYKTIFICVVLFVIGFYLGKKFFSIIKSMSQNDTITERAITYSKTSYGSSLLNIFGILEVILKGCIIPAFAIWYRRLSLKGIQDKQEIKDFMKMEIMVMCSIYVSVLAMSIFILGRFNNYLNLFTFVMISSCFFQRVTIKRKRYRLGGIYWLGVFLVVSSMSFKGYFDNTYGSTQKKRYMLYYPYYSRLEPKEDPKREEILRFSFHIK